MFRKRTRPQTTTQSAADESLGAAAAAAAAAVAAATEGDYGEALSQAAQAVAAAAPAVEGLAATEEPQPAATAAAVTGLTDEDLSAIVDAVDNRVQAASEPVAARLSDEQLAAIAAAIAARVTPSLAEKKAVPPDLTAEQMASLADSVAARVKATVAARPVEPLGSSVGLNESDLTLIADAVAARIATEAGAAGARNFAAQASVSEAAQSMADAVQAVADDAARQALAEAQLKAEHRASSGMALLKGLLLGAGAGVAAAYFLSPYSGEQLRSLIADRLGGNKSWQPPMPSAGPEPGFAAWESTLRSNPPTAADIRATTHSWAAADATDAITLPNIPVVPTHSDDGEPDASDASTPKA